jgi:hypothetical protein
MIMMNSKTYTVLIPKETAWEPGVTDAVVRHRFRHWRRMLGTSIFSKAHEDRSLGDPRRIRRWNIPILHFGVLTHVQHLAASVRTLRQIHK